MIDSTWITLISLGVTVLFMLGVPVFLVIAYWVIGCSLVLGMPFDNIGAALTYAFSNGFALLAMPLFILTGDLINKAGIARREHGCTCPREAPVCTCGFVQTLRSVSRKPILPGEEELVGMGVSYCATCDGMLYRGKNIAVLSASAEGVQETLFLEKDQTVHGPMLTTNVFIRGANGWRLLSRHTSAAAEAAESEGDTLDSQKHTLH